MDILHLNRCISKIGHFPEKNFEKTLYAKFSRQLWIHGHLTIDMNVLMESLAYYFTFFFRRIGQRFVSSRRWLSR